MQEDPSNGELSRQLATATEMMKQGFAEIHKRQDTTNGKVLKSEEFRIKMETWIGTFKWLFGALGLGNIVLIVKTIFDVLK